jgi:hypothetical protein
VIEKNLSTILTAIACYFHNPEAFRNASRNVNNEVFRKRFETVELLGVISPVLGFAKVSNVSLIEMSILICLDKNEATTFMGRIRNGLKNAKNWLHISAR